MKKLITFSRLILGVSAFLLCSAVTSYAFPISTVRITAINTETGEITLTNLGCTTWDVSTYWLCDQPTYTMLGSITPTAGDYMLDPFEKVTLIWTGIAGNADGEVGLYNTNSFGSSVAVEDYFQWGSDPHGRTDEAQAAGVWTIGDFLVDPGAYSFSGGISDYGSSFWDFKGCTYFTATNFNANASIDDGSCDFFFCLGDANASYNVDILDLIAVSSNFGSGCAD